MGAQGLAEVDFGAWPGKPEMELDVATAGVVVTSLVEAWLLADATTDHTVDEHVAEDQQLDVQARFKSNGIITIRIGINDREQMKAIQEQGKPTERLQDSRTYGKWSVAWVWN